MIEMIEWCICKFFRSQKESWRRSQKEKKKNRNGIDKGNKDMKFKNTNEDSNPFITPKNSSKSETNTGIDVNELANKKCGNKLLLFIVYMILGAHRFYQYPPFDLQEE
jgi:hypothetical protein